MPPWVKVTGIIVSIVVLLLVVIVLLTGGDHGPGRHGGGAVQSFDRTPTFLALEDGQRQGP